VLETPKVETDAGSMDVVNLRTLRDLVKKRTTGTAAR